MVKSPRIEFTVLWFAFEDLYPNGTYLGRSDPRVRG
jgi:hypothetical protein